MIKAGLKNYFVNLKHFFTPIGTLACGVFIGLSIFIPGSLAILGALVERLAEIINDASIDFEHVKDYIVGAVRALDWSDPIVSLKTMLNREWLSSVLNECLSIIGGELQPYADAITEAVAAAFSGIFLLFVLFIVLAVIGLVCGYLLTRFLVRRTMARRTFKKFLFAVLVDSLVTAGLISLSFWLLTVWAPSIYITSIITPVIFGALALMSAYLVHGRGVVSFGTVFNLINLVKLLLINALIFVISTAFFILTVLATNAVAGLMIGFSFVEIAFLVTSMNAEGYVVELVSRSSPPEEEAQPAAA